MVPLRVSECPRNLPDLQEEFAFPNVRRALVKARQEADWEALRRVWRALWKDEGHIDQESQGFRESGRSPGRHSCHQLRFC